MHFRKVTIAFTISLIFLAMLFHGPILGVNDGSRWDTVWSLNHGRGYVIDDAPYGTPDKVQREGHFYSSKPPLLPTIIAGVTSFVNIATGLEIPKNSRIVTILILVLFNLLPFAVFLILYGRFLDRSGYNEKTKRFCILTASFGTYLTAYNISLNNHTIAAWGCFFAIYCFFRIIYDARLDWNYFFLCGLFSAWTVVNELPAAIFGAVVFAYLFCRHRSQTLKFFLPGALMIITPHFITTYLSTGGVLPYYAKVNSSVYKYPGSYWNDPTGIDAVHESALVRLFNFTLGHHGILSLSPVFIISFYGMYKNIKLTPVNKASGILCLVLLLFYTFITSSYGGVCQGARWFFWLIPICLINLPEALEHFISSKVAHVYVYVLLAISGFSTINAMIPDSGPWSTSWLHSLMRVSGLVSY